MLEVRDQIRLPFKRMLELCLDSIAYRLFRSVVTVIIIILAIAFLASIMVEGYLGRAVCDTVVRKVRQRAAYTRFLSKISHVESEEKQLLSLAALIVGTSDYENARAWSATRAEEWEDFLSGARRAAVYLEFFEGMSVGRRALLVEGRHGLGIFDWLAENEANFRLFGERLEPMRSLKLPGSFEGFNQFIAGWPAYRRQLNTVRANYTGAIGRVAQHHANGGPGAALMQAVAAGKGGVFFAQMEADGFRVDVSEIQGILAGAAYQKDVAWAMDQLRKGPVRTGWLRQFQEYFSPSQALQSVADEPGRMEWIKQALAGDESFDAERLRRIAVDYREQAGLLDAEQRLLNRYGHSRGLSEKAIWLIIVSFVVCIVGIANAMLMSVLERFKEIATMKCLGARNGTIGFMFITESAIMGLIGGVIGMVLGALIVIVRQSVAYGGLLYEQFPWSQIGVAFAACFVCSLMLSGVAAVYPARVASRMAPMDAMRVD